MSSVSLTPSIARPGIPTTTPLTQVPTPGSSAFSSLLRGGNSTPVSAPSLAGRVSPQIALAARCGTTVNPALVPTNVPPPADSGGRSINLKD